MRQIYDWGHIKNVLLNLKLPTANKIQQSILSKQNRTVVGGKQKTWQNTNNSGDQNKQQTELGTLFQAESKHCSSVKTKEKRP